MQNAKAPEVVKTSGAIKRDQNDGGLGRNRTTDTRIFNLHPKSLQINALHMKGFYKGLHFWRTALLVQKSQAITFVEGLIGTTDRIRRPREAPLSGT